MNLIKKNFNFFLIFSTLFIIYVPLFRYYIDLNNNKGHTFMTADWLINYNHGYISRGFFGTFLINFFNNQESMLDFLSLVLIVIYISIFYFISKIFTQSKQNIVSLILIFSPATFLFNIYDSQGSFRKEILGILSLVILASSIKEKKSHHIYLSGIIYTIGIFSHSVNLFFLTTLIFILFYKIGSKKFSHYIFFIGSTFLNILFYFIFSNSEQDLYTKRNLMCQDLENLGLSSLCGYGSFDFVVWDFNAAYLITQNIIINENRNASYFYIFLFFLSMIPFLFDKNFYKELKYYFLIGLSFTPLFLIGYDWGRWIYIISICFLIVYLTAKKNLINEKVMFIFLVYPVLFRIEHCCKPLVHFQDNFMFNNLKYLISNIMSIL